MNRDQQRQAEIERKLAKQKRKKAEKPDPLPTKKEQGEFRIDKYINLMSLIKKKIKVVKKQSYEELKNKKRVLSNLL